MLVVCDSTPHDTSAATGAADRWTGAERLRRLPTRLLSLAAIHTNRRINEELARVDARKSHHAVLATLEAAATYRARSPLHLVDRIARPVLLAHGLEDTVVPPIQARVMAEALERRGVPHVLVAVPGEGHGFRRPESIRRGVEVELSFYLAALGCRPARPIGLWPPEA